jgi:Hypervirulence associated proteins TUDOR domain
MSIRTGTTVTWRWRAGTAEGRVTAIHPRPVVRTIKGARIKRLGSPEDPAYEIEQDDGTKVLKLRSEVAQKHRH